MACPLLPASAVTTGMTKSKADDQLTGLVYFSQLNGPMWLTLGRLLAPLVVCPLILADQAGLAALAFALAALTDWGDGALARRWGQTSALGETLDPVADKVLVVLTLFALAATGALGAFALPLTFALLFREIAVTALRQHAAIAVRTLSKLKTVLQNCAVGALILGDWLGGWLGGFGQVLLAVSLVFGFYTAWLYLREAVA